MKAMKGQENDVSMAIKLFRSNYARDLISTNSVKYDRIYEPVSVSFE